MNTEKMRRTLERSREAQEVEENRRWLAAMTPEHRHHHLTRPGWPCGECVAAGARVLQASLARFREGLPQVPRDA